MKDAQTRQRIATRCIHGGDTVDPATGAVMPPIYTATTYRQAEFGAPMDYAYSRVANPTRDALERCVADLEGGVRGIAYGAGMAATAGVLDLLDAGDHVVAPTDLYGGTLRLFNQVRTRTAGLRFSYADFTDPAQVAAAIRPETRLLWVETPTNPLLKIIDLAQMVELAREHDLLVCVDNTFATPILQRPLELGCDIVMHSTTKYLGGHCDVIGGVNVVADEEIGKRLVSLRSAVGSVPGPFDAYLVLRGIKTLALRMERHQANAMALANWLKAQPGISAVHYPGLPEHPQHELAARQMGGFGGMLALVLDGDVASFMNALQVFVVAESLGGVESLAGHPATMSHSNVPPAERLAMGIPDNMIRLSAGIEDPADLIADLAHALATARA
jgi:cystathionine gamma-lyase